jgi:hypothetical protein
MQRIISSIIIGSSIIWGITIHTKQTFKNELMKSSITIQGVAEKEVKADFFEWKFEYETVGSNVEEVKKSTKNAKKEIVEMLVTSGLTPEIDFDVYPKNMKHSKTVEGKNVFTISQFYSIHSLKLKEANKAFELSALLPEKGIAILSHNPGRAYRVKNTKLLEKKLLPLAIQDAKKRAEELSKVNDWKIVGAPTIRYVYTELRDKNFSENLMSNEAVSVDQTARITVNVKFKTLENTN